MQKSYRLKRGKRKTGARTSYDGTFVEDYEYVAGHGDLDECNGRFGVTPEYPDGTYHYFVTENFPFIPRYFRGLPDESFKRRGNAGSRGQGMRPNERRPGGQHQPPD